MSAGPGRRDRGATGRAPRGPTAARATAARAPQPVSVQGGHVVDLAFLFAELLGAPGVTQADLGRRYRKSPGYVSVVCRLGRALRELPPEARDALRVPHFTLKAAQALVSRHPDPAALRAAAVRLAVAPPAGLVGGAGQRGARTRARQGVPGQWDRAPDRPDAIDPLPEPRDALSRRAAFTYVWDAELARSDPRAVLAEFEAFVRATTDEVVRRLRHAAGDVGDLRVDPWHGSPLYATSSRHHGPGTAAPDGGSVGQTPDADAPDAGANPAAGPGAGGGQGGRGRVSATGVDETTLRRLDARVAETLRAHRARLDAFLAERERGRERRTGVAPGGGAPGTGPGGSLAALPVDQADIDADLA